MRETMLASALLCNQSGGHRSAAASSMDSVLHLTDSLVPCTLDHPVCRSLRHGFFHGGCWAAVPAWLSHVSAWLFRDTVVWARMGDSGRNKDQSGLLNDDANEAGCTSQQGVD